MSVANQRLDCHAIMRYNQDVDARGFMLLNSVMITGDSQWFVWAVKSMLDIVNWRDNWAIKFGKLSR